MRPIRAITLTTFGFMPGMAAAEAPTLTLDGFADLGGIAVGAKAGAAGPES